MLHGGEAVIRLKGHPSEESLCDPLDIRGFIHGMRATGRYVSHLRGRVGETVEFRDRDGKLIEADGLLVVNRRDNYRVFLGHYQGAPITHIIPIVEGKAKVPVDILLGSVAIIPNEVVIGYGIMGIIEGVRTKPVLTAVTTPILIGLFAIPITYTYPSEEVFLVPLIPGFHRQLDYMNPNPWFPQDLTVERYMLPLFENRYERRDKDTGNLIFSLRSNASDRYGAWRYWKLVRKRIRKRYEMQSGWQEPDIRLEPYHHKKLMTFIGDELARIEELPPTAKKDGEPDASLPAGASSYNSGYE